MNHTHIPISQLPNSKKTLNYSFQKITLKLRNLFSYLEFIQIYTKDKGQISHLHSWLKQKHKSPPNNFNPQTLNQIILLFPTVKQAVPESDTSKHANLRNLSLQGKPGFQRHFPWVLVTIKNIYPRTLSDFSWAPSTSTNLPNIDVASKKKKKKNYTFAHNPTKAMHEWLWELACSVIS